MSLGGFIFGIAMMVAGFFMVRKTDFFLMNFGDLGEMFGAYNASWLSWKVMGVFLMILGFLIAFGLLQLFLEVTIGRLFIFGGYS